MDVRRQHLPLPAVQCVNSSGFCSGTSGPSGWEHHCHCWASYLRGVRPIRAPALFLLKWATAANFLSFFYFIFWIIPPSSGSLTVAMATEAVRLAVVTDMPQRCFPIWHCGSPPFSLLSPLQPPSAHPPALLWDDAFVATRLRWHGLAVLTDISPNWGSDTKDGEALRRWPSPKKRNHLPGREGRARRVCVLRIYRFKFNSENVKAKPASHPGGFDCPAAVITARWLPDQGCVCVHDPSWQGDAAKDNRELDSPWRRIFSLHSWINLPAAIHANTISSILHLWETGGKHTPADMGRTNANAAPEGPH